VSTVTLPWKAAPDLAFVAQFGDVVTTDGDLVIRASRWNLDVTPNISAAELVGMLFTPTDAERQQVAAPDRAGDPDCDEMKGVPVTPPPTPAPTTMPPGTDVTTTSTQSPPSGA
jgi:hypothetical protein